MLRTLEQTLQTICADLGFEYPKDVIIAEPPAHIGVDFSANIAMLLGKKLGKNPREVAEEIKNKLIETEGVESVELAGPGFLNIKLNNFWYLERIGQTIASIPQADTPIKFIVEYISANPAGPLHIGNARGGPIGETICRILEAQGHTVTREFYVNDIGGQANMFAASVLHHYLEHFGVPSTFPVKGYPAPYIKKLALEIAESEGDRIVQLPEHERQEDLRKIAIAKMVEKIKATTDRMGISFDNWYWQSQLIETGLTGETLDLLEEREATIEKDGAIWLKSGIQDDDRESVLVKSDGSTTYFIDDIAYHRDKLGARQFDKAIVLLGANHSGHIPRMQAAMQALGVEPSRYEAILYQYVQLKEGGETRRMAKREGSFVTADEVLDQVPLEVFTYFMLSKANETHLDFDLQLAKDTSEKNPIYYIQYAHARICSVLEKAKSQGVEKGELPENYEFSEQERQLIRHLTGFGTVISEIAENYRTHVLPNYLHELATRYHHFYAHQRIISDNPGETAVRILLSEATAATLKKGLALLNIVALDKM